MVHEPFPDLFIKKNILEKKYDLHAGWMIDNIKSIRITKNDSDSIQIVVYHNPDKYETRPSPYIIRIKE